MPNPKMKSLRMIQSMEMLDLDLRDSQVEKKFDDMKKFLKKNVSENKNMMLMPLVELRLSLN